MKKKISIKYSEKTWLKAGRVFVGQNQKVWEKAFLIKAMGVN